MHSPGAAIGSYRLVRRLGEGAMGVVYEAEHTVMERRVAIKLLHRELLAQPSSVQRFLNEARAMSRIHHPGLVEILEFGELPDSGPYLVMELLIGETLSARTTRSQPWSPTLALDVTRQIAEAMTCAHAQGVVHRDLKPSNLMLIAAAESSELPRIKVLDFGIAKLSPAGGGHSEANPLTRSQAVLGTAEYMAPEQCRDAHGVDAKADVYALGVILYELLAGQRPFTAATALEVMLLHLQAPPPLLKTSCPELGNDLLALVHQMLAKAPDERPTMAAVAQQLAANLLQTPRPAQTADDPVPAKETLAGIKLVSHSNAAKKPRPKQARWMLLGIGGLASLLIGSGFLLRTPKRASQAAVISNVAPAALTSSPPPIAAPPPIEQPHEVKPTAEPPIALPSAQKPETPTPRAPWLRRSVSRPPAAAAPPVLFKNKDPDGL